METERRGLELHAEPLVQLFQMAPNMFPCHRGVREALLALNAELKIPSCKERYEFKLSSEAADVWRRTREPEEANVDSIDFGFGTASATTLGAR